MKVKKWRTSEDKPSYSVLSERVRLGIRLALVGLVYFATARLGLLFVVQPEGLAGIWPASGIALAALLLSLRKNHPRIVYWATLAVIFIVNLLTNVSSGNTLTISLGFACANTIEPAVAAFVFLLVYNSGERTKGSAAAPIVFEKISQVLALVAAAGTALVTAFIGAWVPTLGFGAAYWDVWRAWWVEDSLGILLFTPVVLLFSVRRPIFQARSTRWWIELALLMVGTGLVSWFSFGNNEMTNPFGMRPYMLFLFVFWAAQRFSLRVVYLVLVLLAGIALGATATGLGSFPLGGSLPSERLVFVQVYLFVISLTGFVLGTIFTERKQAVAALRERNTFIETILENAPIGFAVNRISDGQATFISSKFDTLYGVPVGGISSVDEYFEKVYLDPVFREQMRARVMADIASGDPARMRWENIPLTTLAGEHRVITATNIIVSEQDLMISTVQDVTERWRAEELLRETNAALEVAYDATLQGWSNALELRERETAGHSQRVVEKTLALAKAMGIDPAQMDHIYRGALLHDIGKMGIPDRILLKPGPLDDEEWEVMRRHPVHAYNWLAKIPYLTPALDIPHYHHERWDGSGYPAGLAGEAIPLPARIFAVVDVWDALAFDRPYRVAWRKEAIYQYLADQVGIQFDPKVVCTFLGLMEQTL